MSGQNFVDVLQFVLIVIIARVQIVHFSYIKHLSDVLESCLSQHQSNILVLAGGAE